MKNLAFLDIGLSNSKGMRKLLFLLSALLLCMSCEKEELDMAEQKNINNRFVGLWVEVDHPKTQCGYRYFSEDFQYTYTVEFSNGTSKEMPPKSYHFEDGPECSKATVYRIVMHGGITSNICIYSQQLYLFNEDADPEECVGNVEYAYQQVF